MGLSNHRALQTVFVRVLTFICSIQKQHAILTCKSGNVEIEPGTSAKIKVNGVPLTIRKRLTHKDRLLFGKILQMYILYSLR